LSVGNAEVLRCFCSKAVYAQVAKDLNNGVVYNDNPQGKSIATRGLTVYSSDKQEATLEVSRCTNDSQIWGFSPPEVIAKSIGGVPPHHRADRLRVFPPPHASSHGIPRGP